MKLINKEIQESYCNDEILQLLYDKGMRFHQWVEFYTMAHSLAEQRFNEGDVSHLKNSVTHQIVVEWLRANFGIDVHSKREYERPFLEGEKVRFKWVSMIDKVDSKGPAYADSFGQFDTPQEAIEAGILYTLKNLIP